MNKEDQPNPLRAQISSKMQEKPTEELLEIWSQHDRKAWTDEAFKVIQDILLARLGSVPEPEITAPADEEETAETGMRLVRIAIWARTLSRLVLGVATLISITQLIMSFSQDLSFGSFVILLLGSFQTQLVGAAFYVILQALAELLMLQKIGATHASPLLFSEPFLK